MSATSDQTVQQALNEALGEETVNTLWKAGDRWPELVERAAAELFIWRECDTTTAETIRGALLTIQTEGYVVPN